MTALPFAPGWALALVRSAAADWRRLLAVAGQVGEKLPSRGDGLVVAACKLAGAYTKVSQAFEGGYDDAQVASRLERIGARRVYNAVMAQALVSGAVRGAFVERRWSVGEDATVIDLTHRESGQRVWLVEWKGGARGPRLSDQLWARPGTDLSMLAETFWAAVGDACDLEFVRPRDPWEDAVARFSPAPPDDAPLLGSAPARLETFVAQHRLYARDGEPRAYLFVGPPGTGKSSLAMRAGRLLGGRTLRLDADGLTESAVSDLGMLFDALGPLNVVVDELDRAAGFEACSARLFRMLTESKARWPGMTFILTVNGTKRFAPATLRPGRISEAIEFPAPGEADRRAVLGGYLRAKGVARVVDLDALAKATEGLTEDYLREVAVQLRYHDASEAVARARRLYELANAPKAPNSNAPEAPRG